MLVIRLQRTGRRNASAFRMVVAEHSMPVKGRFKEVVGFYLPTRDPAELTVNEERASYWIAQGAVPSDTVARLLSKSGVKGLEKFIKPYTRKKTKKAGEEGQQESAASADEGVPEVFSDEKQEEEKAPADEGGKEGKAKGGEKQEAEDSPKEQKEEEDTKGVGDEGKTRGQGKVAEEEGEAGGDEEGKGTEQSAPESEQSEADEDDNGKKE